MINTCKNDTKQHYIPVEKLTYATRLKQMLREELGFQGKPKVLDLLVSEIEAITNECYVDEQQVGLGQVRVMVPSVEDRPSWGQTIDETKLVTVTLTLFASEDTEGYKNNEKSAVILQRRLARVAREAVKQGGVLSHATAACLLGIKQQTVSKYTAAYYQCEGKIIPLRGYVHDIGRTTTHKRWIIEMYLNGYTEKEIQQKTDHRIQSIERYLRRYRSVEQAVEELHTLDAHKISRLLGISESSAREYSAIYAEYKSTSKIRRLDFHADIKKQTEERVDEDGKIDVGSKVEYLDKGLIIQARRASIEEYLRGKGEVLSKEGMQYRVENKSGLVVSENRWYSHTLLKGGNTLDYLVEMEGVDFKKAVEILSHGNMIPSQLDKTIRIGQEVVVPERNTDDKRVMAYLVKTRGLSVDVIIPLLKQGRIYESIGTHNCVLTGIDENSRIRYIMQRSTQPENNLKFESEGSDKRYSFSLKGKSDILCVFESPIDLLSYMTLQNEVMKGQPHMLSLGGVSDIALEAYIERTPEVHKIVFCLDNDKTGNEACETLYRKYSMKGFSVSKDFPKRKDWNEELLNRIGCNS